MLRQRAMVVRAQFEASGTNISEWARERGFRLQMVHQILRGERPCLRGESHRIAVALGIKDDAPAPGTGPAKAPRSGGADLEPAR
ncbi:DNA-binding protein [Sphingomonas adhaesiva]|uniref:DNA-binding protein n=1 Tax=Sphingomonas adhaesiva TaxID=28212 RepID=UPI002FF728D6